MHDHKRALSLLGLFALALFGTARADAGDAVEAMCLDLDRSAAVCKCAAKRLRAEVGEDDYALYEAVGRIYRRQLEQGKGRGDAWNTGVGVAASERDMGRTAILQRTNAVARTHRKAIKACQ